MSIAESFAAEQLRGRLEVAAPPPRTDYAEHLYGRAEDAATSGWESMAAAYKSWVAKLKFSDFPEYESVKHLVQARNAMVHGLGRFTPKQQRAGDFSTHVAGLTSLGFKIDAEHRVSLDHRTLEEAALLLRRFMVWLDHKLATSP